MPRLVELAIRLAQRQCATPHGVLEDSRSVSAISKLELSRLARFHELHSRIISDHGTNVCLARRPGQRAVMHRNNHLRLEVTIHRQPRCTSILSVGYCAASHQYDVGMIKFLDQ